MGTQWEQTPEKTQIPSISNKPKTQKKKNLSPIECMLSIHIGCMKLLIACHHLQLGLYPNFIVLPLFESWRTHKS